MKISSRRKLPPSRPTKSPRRTLPLSAPAQGDKLCAAPGSVPEKKRHRYKHPHGTKRGRKVSKTTALRKSQSQIPRVIARLGTSLVNSPRGIWDLKTHLLVVSLIYDRLAVKQSRISTRELTALAHILADQRKSMIPGLAPGKSLRGKGGARGKLPRGFDSIIEQMYGDPASKSL